MKPFTFKREAQLLLLLGLLPLVAILAGIVIPSWHRQGERVETLVAAVIVGLWVWDRWQGGRR